MAQRSGWDYASGFHNSFFETWRQSGLIPTIIIFATGLITVSRLLSKYRARNKAAADFAIASLIFIFYGIVESGFGVGFSFGFVVLIRIGWILREKDRQFKCNLEQTNA